MKKLRIIADQNMPLAEDYFCQLGEVELGFGGVFNSRCSQLKKRQFQELLNR